MRFLALLLLAARVMTGDPVFSASASSVAVYDFVEVSAHVAAGMGNPFAGASLTGELQHDGEPSVDVEGFCDAPDGSIYRIRFMAAKPGTYRYTVTLRSGGQTERYQGSFTAIAKGKRGTVRIDREHPFHFLWEGTHGKHRTADATDQRRVWGYEDH